MRPRGISNQRIKRKYLDYLKEARGQGDATISHVAKSLSRFEESTRRKEFRRFHREQVMAFKDKLRASVNVRTGKPLSKSTVHAVLRDLRAFFFWLAREPGFSSHIAYSDADYFNPSAKEVGVANARREKRVPTLDQVRHVISAMSAQTPLERRDRALVAFTMLTGARVSALASFRLQHVDLADGFVDQDARAVRTKGAKTFRTYFMLVDERALSIVSEWIHELESEHLLGPNDPLFPSTKVGIDAKGEFAPVGISRDGWASSEPVREIFRRAFAAAGIPYFNPHSFRDMLVRHAMKFNLSPEAMKAWSQNLGHAEVLTTLSSYGAVPLSRQGELIKWLNCATEGPDPLNDPDVAALIDRLANRRRQAGN